MSRRSLLVLPLFLLSVALAEDQERDRIEFGGIRLTLGMKKDQVFDLLQARYRVEPPPSSQKQRAGLFWVSEKGSRDSGTIGALYFPEGTLTEATRYWTPQEPAARPAVNTVRALFDAINLSVPDLYPRRCVIALSHADPHSEITGMAMTCGEKIVNIGVLSRQGEDDKVYINELLVAPLSGGRASQSDR